MTKEEKLRKIAHKKDALWAKIRGMLDFIHTYVTSMGKEDRDAIKKVALLVERYEKLLLEEKALKKS